VARRLHVIAEGSQDWDLKNFTEIMGQKITQVMAINYSVKG